MPDLCGVHGDITMVPGAEPLPIPPCTDEATEAVRFRCERGHERERRVCLRHAAALWLGGPLGQSLCRECFETDGVDSLLTPLEGP